MFGQPVLADITVVVALALVAVAFGTAAVTGDFADIEAEFGVSDVGTALTVSLMVVGFGWVFNSRYVSRMLSAA
ncbi:hypothetical protein B0H17DRAFT_1218433 [Mycena rosella]|uniref:Uncharacterized protein n=1 Tax=Mycena rosella TaxID=1033263 RepID=A0AAD7BQP6_MYCRO|nr:hypothetical protein B0H17DRAFT_1218433 [Mycena rosella]